MDQATDASADQGTETLAATHLAADVMKAAFNEGRPVLKAEHYQVHASRREAPGVAELHRRDTDVFHILEGSATIVLGGSIVDAREIDPLEVRGTSIEGGKAQRLAPGDVLVIPPGVPHWFRDVEGPLRYFTVKVSQPGVP